MQEILENGTKQAVLNRRRFLATGVVAAAVAPLQGFAAEQGSVFATEARVENVYPLTGSEGTNIFITGRGFDPEPENNIVLLGDGRARVEVVEASANYLVGVIGPITAPGSGSLRVVTGIRRTPADRAMALADGHSVATNCQAFGVCSRTEPSASFQLVRRSPGAVEGDLSSGVALELGTGPTMAYRSAEVEILLPSGAVQRFDVTLPTGPATSTHFANHLASHLDRSGGLHATSRGSKVLITRSSSGSAEWVRLDLRMVGKTKRGPWLTNWSGRVT